MALDTLLRVAGDLARTWPDFTKRKREGEGDRDTNAFMAELKKRTTEALGDACEPDKKVIDESNLTFDYYLPGEATAVEFGFSLWNSRSEFERDIFKALLAKDREKHIRRLVLVGKPGTLKQLATPGAQAIIEFVRRRFGIETDVREIPPPEITATRRASATGGTLGTGLDCGVSCCDPPCGCGDCLRCGG